MRHFRSHPTHVYIKWVNIDVCIIFFSSRVFEKTSRDVYPIWSPLYCALAALPVSSLHSSTWINQSLGIEMFSGIFSVSLYCASSLDPHLNSGYQGTLLQVSSFDLFRCSSAATRIRTVHHNFFSMFIDRREFFSNVDENEVHPPFHHLIPTDSFDLFWTMWNTNQSTFRGRRLLVLESLLIHHPHATIIMLSSTLNDTQLFLPFRRRGYRVYSFDVSLPHILKWKWYLSDQSKEFLHHWNTTSTYFYSHLSDYLRAIVLYLYGGTYMDMDALILQPLPRHEFIGRDRSGGGAACTWCIRNTVGQYLAPGFMRFRAHRTVFRDILKGRL